MKKYRDKSGFIGSVSVDGSTINTKGSAKYTSKYLANHPELTMPEYIDSINIKNVLDIYDNEVGKNVKNKRKVYDFERNKMQNIENIVKYLKEGRVCIDPYNIFTIHEPKLRLVMSMSVRDKIINHFITRYSLERNLTKFLLPCNCATRKGMGTKYGRDKVLEYINRIKRKHKVFYILKIDISKYFYSIDHEILKSLLIDKLTSFEYDIICKIIDSTNLAYINKRIDTITEDEPLPRYNLGKGLPIGNMSSQFLSIFYLYKLDWYITHTLGLKYYVRYMDDFIIINEDKEKLEEALTKIQSILVKDYKLKVNEKKTMIVSSKTGFSFLGITVKVVDNKTVVDITKANRERIKKRLKEVRWMLDNAMITHYQAFSSVMNYLYSYKNINKVLIRRYIDRYFYEK